MKYVLVSLLIFVAAGPATKPESVYPLTTHSERCLNRLLRGNVINQRDNAKEIRVVGEGVKKQDIKISAYLASHQVSDRVKEALMEARPCPTMPEELLLLIGKYTETHIERENGRRAEWGPYGFAMLEDCRELAVSDGVVKSVEPCTGRGSYSSLIPD